MAQPNKESWGNVTAPAPIGPGRGLPRALDLFSGAGGVSVGLERAGFEVTAVDIKPQPHHRGGRFVQADALTFPLEGYDFIWASPPCQGYTALRALHQGREYPDLVGPIRARLEEVGATWVIENVLGAPLRHGFVLCGASFGLGCWGDGGEWRALRRHRLFESSMAVLAPPCQCGYAPIVGVYGHGATRPNKHKGGRAGYSGRAGEARAAMGIEWMTRDEVSQAIPPAYAEWIGRQALQYLRAVAVREEIGE